MCLLLEYFLWEKYPPNLISGLVDGFQAGFCVIFEVAFLTAG